MGPLHGVTVLDLTRLLPGPFGSWLLRSWGVRVIKVEDPHMGDYMRDLEPAWYDHMNAGAESIVLDLKQPKARNAFLRLAAEADMVMEGFRPGVMERLGLSFDVLHQVNPRLVLVSIGGYGPDSTKAGHDVTFLARSGLLSLMQEMPPLQIADLAGGLTAAAGGLAALLGARTTGRGTHVQTSLLDAVFGLGSLFAAQVQSGVDLVRSEMQLAGALPCYNVYPTADGGRVVLGALEPKFWSGFCQAVDRPDWVRRHNDPAMKEELEQLFLSRPLDDWAAIAAEWDICLEPVLTVREAVAGRSSLQPVSFDGIRPGSTGPAPTRGQHTRQILQEFRFSLQEIEEVTA